MPDINSYLLQMPRFNMAAVMLLSLALVGSAQAAHENVWNPPYCCFIVDSLLAILIQSSTLRTGCVIF